jgi:hypothetical protein
VLQGLLPEYGQHIAQHPDSLLVRIYGLYRIRGGRTRFMLMENVVYLASGQAPDSVFDLKGESF